MDCEWLMVESVLDIVVEVEWVCFDEVVIVCLWMWV